MLYRAEFAIFGSLSMAWFRSIKATADTIIQVTWNIEDEIIKPDHGKTSEKFQVAVPGVDWVNCIIRQ